jgi:hypothetical protein
LARDRQIPIYRRRPVLRRIATRIDPAALELIERLADGARTFAERADEIEVRYGDFTSPSTRRPM